MKCTNCNTEIKEQTNFCPSCGMKLNKDAQDAPIQQVHVKKQSFVMVSNKNEMFKAVSLLALYTGIGMMLVSLFFAFKGFGLFAHRDINMLTVWITYGVSTAVAIAGGLFYFLKFRNKN